MTREARCGDEQDGTDDRCRCQVVGVELDDEEYEHDGQGDLPMAEPVPEGWLRDPDSDHGSVHPGCFTVQELREAVAEQRQIVRRLLGEFDQD